MPKQLAPGLISWASILEEQAQAQAEMTAGLPWVKGLALMPDAHWGMGSTVGSVVATEDVVMPACVGVDIGCGMSAIRTNLTLPDIERRKANDVPLSMLRGAIQREIPVSAGNYRRDLSATAKQRVTALVSLAMENGVDLHHSPKWREQLGTLGGGNHFIEVSLDEEDRVWVFLHSGSRGVGNKIAKKHVAIATKLCKQFYVDLPHPDLAFLVRGTNEYASYISELRWAQEFAYQNRAEMIDQVLEALSDWYNEPISQDEIIQCHHNYTEMENHHGKNLSITRKGAINAAKGKRGLIPGSMGTRSYVVTGLGNPASYSSAPHGAGRNFSRGEARRRFSEQDLVTAMAGIEWRDDIAGSLVDEIPGAYKPIDVIMEDAKDLVKIDHELRQILNIKGN